MIKIGICEMGENNNRKIYKKLMEYERIQKTLFEIICWSSGEQLCNYLMSGKTIDLLFLSIELPKINGIAVSYFIRNIMNNMKIQIVFMANTDKYAMGLFKMHPFDFILKPIKQTAIEEVMNHYFRYIGLKNSCFIYQRNNHIFRCFYYNIMYFCSNNRKVKIVLHNGEEEFYGKIIDIKEKLPKEFIQIHQSFIINYFFIKQYAYDYVVLSDNTILSISRPYRAEVKEKIEKVIPKST